MIFTADYLEKLAKAKKEGVCFYCPDKAEHENTEGNPCDSLEVPVCNEHWDFGPNRIYIRHPPSIYGYR